MPVPLDADPRSEGSIGVVMTIGDIIAVRNAGHRLGPGASAATLYRRVQYGGRKGRRASQRLAASALDGLYIVTGVHSGTPVLTPYQGRRTVDNTPCTCGEANTQEKGRHDEDCPSVGL